MEKIEAADASYRDCFRGTNLRRTGIICMAWIIQILNGQSMTGYAVTMLRAAGMKELQAFNYNMGIQSVNIVCTAITIALIGNVGRRIFFFWGSSGIGLAMLIIGILGFIPGKANISIAVAVVFIIVQIIFKLTLGPVTYVIVGETPSNRTRAQAIVLGRAIYVVGQIIVGQLNPRMLNNTADAWNWGAKAGLFYFGLCCIWAVWIFFFLPETKNRTFAEIDYLFQTKVGARSFTTAPVDIFEITPPSGKVNSHTHED
jgi:SP family general alpha glucoside:H+ symporter-like MFS transporter